MAQLSDSSPSGAGILGSVRQALGLFANVNKTPVVGDQSVSPMDEYESSFSEEDVILLVSEWRKRYDGYYADIKKQQDASFDYWLGKQKSSAIDNIEGTNIVDNVIFEAVETFLPIATRSNPEPLVEADDSEEGQVLAKDVKDALVYEASASRQNLRMKLKRGTRNWATMLIGVWRIDWNIHQDAIDTVVVNPQRMLFDPDGYVDEKGFFHGDWLGERVTKSASRLAQMFPNKKAEIMAKAKSKKGTKLEYIKWWYQGTDVFFTLDQTVLSKNKNPHWNWDGIEKRVDPETLQESEEIIEGKNHLKEPTAPYVFLVVFNTGIQPHDDTSLILQNIGIQDGVNKRYRQIDKNVDAQNNGLIVDGRLMTQEQAAEAASSRRRGAAIRVMGNPREAVVLDGSPQLSSDVWESLKDQRDRLQRIFGVSGSTPSGTSKEETARGKILVNQLDSSRIGGTVTEAIEQSAGSIMNMWVQFMYVHYDNEHFINAVGMQGGAETASLINTRFSKTLTINVKEGSLVPKDPLTQRNEAVDMWSQGSIDPISYYKKLDFPDPVGAAKQLILWQMVQKGQLPPQAYIPDFEVPAQAQGLMPPPGVGGPAVNDPTGQDVMSGQPSIQEAAQKESTQLMQSVPIQQ